MCNAASKAILLVAVASMAMGCSKKNEEKEAASALVETIEQQLAQGQYEEALALMDTVDKKYPTQIDERKRVTALRPKAIEQATMQQMAHADSLLAEITLQLAEIEPKMKHIDGNSLEGYYVVADAYNPSFINATGVEPRINDANLTYYVAAQSKDKTIGLNQVALNTPQQECVSNEIPAGSARVEVVEGSEIAVFIPEEVNELGAWAWDNASQINGATLYGTKGNQKVKLNPKQAASFGIAWKYADLKLRQRSAQLLREKLDRRLQIARDQSANQIE
ncbi:MAG: hypothetical protein LUD17_04930 [Bacteroidales bacterium]|nr:hypothetical protein [Bacteroidales bacterium]